MARLQVLTIELAGRDIVLDGSVEGRPVHAHAPQRELGVLSLVLFKVVQDLVPQPGGHRGQLHRYVVRDKVPPDIRNRVGVEDGVGIGNAEEERHELAALQLGPKLWKVGRKKKGEGQRRNERGQKNTMNQI